MTTGERISLRPGFDAVDLIASFLPVRSVIVGNVALSRVSERSSRGRGVAAITLIGLFLRAQRLR